MTTKSGPISVADSDFLGRWGGGGGQARASSFDVLWPERGEIL